MTLHVGAWLAEQMGLAPDQIEVVGHPATDYGGDQIVTYTRRGQFVARVHLGPPVGEGWLPRHRRRFRSLRATWPGGAAAMLVGSDEDLVW